MLYTKCNTWTFPNYFVLPFMFWYDNGMNVTIILLDATVYTLCIHNVYSDMLNELALYDVYPWEQNSVAENKILFETINSHIGDYTFIISLALLSKIQEYNIICICNSNSSADGTSVTIFS